MPEAPVHPEYGSLVGVPNQWITSFVRNVRRDYNENESEKKKTNATLTETDDCNQNKPYGVEEPAGIIMTSTRTGNEWRRSALPISRLPLLLYRRITDVKENNKIVISVVVRPFHTVLTPPHPPPISVALLHTRKLYKRRFHITTLVYYNVYTSRNIRIVCVRVWRCDFILARCLITRMGDCRRGVLPRTQRRGGNVFRKSVFD